MHQQESEVTTHSEHHIYICMLYMGLPSPVPREPDQRLVLRERQQSSQPKRMRTHILPLPAGASCGSVLSKALAGLQAGAKSAWLHVYSSSGIDNQSNNTQANAFARASHSVCCGSSGCQVLVFGSAPFRQRGRT